MALGSDRISFYLEDEIEPVEQFPMEGWHDTGRTRNMGGEDVRIQHPDSISTGVGWLDKGREKLWGGMYRAAEPAAEFLAYDVPEMLNKGKGIISQATDFVSDRMPKGTTQAGMGGWVTGGGSKQATPELMMDTETITEMPPAKPTSVSEAKAMGSKTFWHNDQEKLAVTFEELQEFKNSGAYDPNSQKSALSQWSDAWSPQMTSEASQAPRRDVRDILIEEEGFELTPYTDAGKQAVGVGHRFKEGEKSRNVTEAEARDLLEEDIDTAYKAVDRLSEQFGVGDIPSELRDELMMMAFQMGATGLSKFKKMWGAMKNGDWEEMIVQMGDSKWAKSQTPARATRTMNRVKALFGV